MSKTCKSCDFCYYRSGYECHFNPPQLLWTYLKHDGGFITESAWPPTTENEGCSHYTNNRGFPSEEALDIH